MPQTTNERGGQVAEVPRIPHDSLVLSEQVPSTSTGSAVSSHQSSLARSIERRAAGAHADSVVYRH